MALKKQQKTSAQLIMRDQVRLLNVGVVFFKLKIVHFWYVLDVEREVNGNSTTIYCQSTAEWTTSW